VDRHRARTCPGGSDPGGTGPAGGSAARTGGEVPPRDPATGRPRPRRLAGAVGLLALALAVPMAVAPAPAGAAPAGVRLEAAAPALVLASQTAWVTPGQAFDLHLRPSGTSVPTARLGLTVSVYSCLSSVSGFDQSVGAGPTGTPVSSTPSPIAVAGLPTAAGSIDLSLPVVVGSSAPAPAGAPFTIRLVPVGQQCQSFPAGVFPVRIQLVDTGGGAVLGSFTTHLVYTDASATTQRLRVGVVLPVQATQSAARAPAPTELLARPDAALATPPTAVVDAVAATVDRVAQHRAVPVTLQVSGQTVALLSSTGHTSTLAQLSQLAATPEVHQLTAAPYVPVDAAGLVGAGLTTELGLQVARGVGTVATALARPVPVATSGLGPWVSVAPLDAGTVSALADDGFGQVVLPAGDLSSTPTDGSATQPFTLPGTRGPGVTAMASDDDLAARFTSSPGNPVLAAHQLVAELAQLYYERPNGVSPRAVLAVAPSGWVDDPAFVDALLGSLDGNPVVQALTTTQVFALFPEPATCHSGCRLTGAVGGGLPTGAIRAQRVRVNGFADAAVGVRPLAQDLGDLVLGGEAQTLRPAQQSAVVANAGLAVDAQLGQVTVQGDKTVTLTATSGLVPVTLTSGAPYPMTATLVLSSDKLLFPDGQTQWTKTGVVLAPHHQNVVYVRVRARAAGVFRLDVSLRSPDGTLRLADGELSVRSTPSSVVGVVLTAGAVVVLAVWWFRTSVRRRAARRAEDAGAAPAGGTPPDDPGVSA
jgi:hypothetical protein